VTDAVRNLQLPLGAEEARSLKLGAVVTVSGAVFTGRSRFYIRAVEDDIVPPLDFEAVNCFFHVGPVMRQENDRWHVVSIEPTSSIRFERYGGDVVRKLNLRTLIGKTTMGRGTAEALREVGGVHLTKIGLCGNELTSQVKRVAGVYFLEELGRTEATWVFEVESFGPFFVDIDAHGNNYFQKLDADVRVNTGEALAGLDVRGDYTFTNVDSEL